jgi:hypothetical protein
MLAKTNEPTGSGLPAVGPGRVARIAPYLLLPELRDDAILVMDADSVLAASVLREARRRLPDGVGGGGVFTGRA